MKKTVIEFILNNLQKLMKERHKRMNITKEYIDQLNTVIQTAIEHGGDSGGAYYCMKDTMFEEVEKLVEMIDDERLEIVWNDEQYKEYPIIKFIEESESTNA